MRYFFWGVRAGRESRLSELIVLSDIFLGSQSWHKESRLSELVRSFRYFFLRVRVSELRGVRSARVMSDIFSSGLGELRGFRSDLGGSQGCQSSKESELSEIFLLIEFILGSKS